MIAFNRFVIAASAAFMLLSFGQSAVANTGATTIGIQQRIETHTKTFSLEDAPKGKLGNAAYGTTMLFASRKLNSKTTGLIALTAREDISESEFANGSANFSVLYQYTPQFRATFGYSHVSNPERESGNYILQSDVNNWLLLSGNYSPKRKHGSKVRYDATATMIMSYSDSSKIDTLKVSRKQSISKKNTIDTGGEVVYSSGFANQDSEVSAYRYSAGITRAIGNRSRIALDVVFQDNVYASNQGDDTAFRLTWTQILRNK